MPPAHTLTLTRAEQLLFQALPAGVKNGWTVKDEILTFEDTDSRRSMRMSVMKLHDPALAGLRKKLLEFKDKPKEAQKVLEGIDMSAINESDLLQIFYGMGPDPIAFMIIQLLQPGSTDDNLAMVSALSNIRNMLLVSFVEAYSSPSYA